MTQRLWYILAILRATAATHAIAGISKPPPPPSEDPEAARQRLQRQIDEFNQRRDARIQSTDDEARLQAEKEEVSAFCTKAKENLAIANSGGRVMERSADGSLAPMTPEQLEERKKLLQTQIDQLCQ